MSVVSTPSSTKNQSKQKPAVLIVDDPAGFGHPHALARLVAVDFRDEILHPAIAQHSRADTLLVVDCLTLWLTHLRMPPAAAEAEENPAPARMESDEAAMLLIALQQAPGPVVLVSNEIGLGVVPLGREVRAFVDALGRLNQQVAAVCQRVTLMAAGLPLALKGGA